jgi:hypothetical protein
LNGGQCSFRPLFLKQSGLVVDIDLYIIDIYKITDVIEKLVGDNRILRVSDRWLPDMLL